jgi:multidrug resistance efflux pump
VQTKADYDRAVGLSRDGVMSQQQLDLAKSNYDAANATVGAAAPISRKPRRKSAKKKLLSRWRKPTLTIP